MQEYAINQEFVYDGKVLKVVKDGSCNDCHFRDPVYEMCKAPVPRQCAPSQHRTVDSCIVSYLYVKDALNVTRLDLTE